MTPEQIKAYNRAKTQRRRAGWDIGLKPVPRGTWYDPAKHGEAIQRIQQEAESMIDEALARKHGDTTRVSLDDLRAMRDRGEIKTHDNAKPGEDLSDEFWDDAE